CTSCHGINQTTQANGPVPTNTPLALVELLKYWTTNSTAVPSLAASQNTNYAQITFVPSARRIGSHLPRPGFHQPGRLVRHCHLCGLEHRADSPGNRDFPDRFAKRKRDHSRPLRNPRARSAVSKNQRDATLTRDERINHEHAPAFGGMPGRIL